MFTTIPMLLLQPVLSLDRPLEWQRSPGPCSSTSVSRELGAARLVGVGGKETQHRGNPRPSKSLGSLQGWCLHQPEFPPLLGRGGSACDYHEAGEVGRRPRVGSSVCSVVTCCRRRWLQQVQRSRWHLLLMSLQEE